MKKGPLVFRRALFLCLLNTQQARFDEATIVGPGGWQSAGGFDSSQNLGRRRNRE